MKDIPGKDLLRFAIREQIMTYFKGHYVQELFGHVPYVSMSEGRLSEPRNRNGRRFNYVSRERNICQPRELVYRGNTLAQLSKAPDCITINKMLKISGSSAAKELAKDIEHTMRMYIPHAKVLVETIRDSTPDKIERVFTKEALKELAVEYGNSIGYRFGADEPMDIPTDIPQPRPSIVIDDVVIAQNEHSQNEHLRRIYEWYEQHVQTSETQPSPTDPAAYWSEFSSVADWDDL